MDSTADPGGFPTRVCAKCSTQSQTTGDYCPHCGHSFVRRGMSARTKWILAAVAVLLAIGVPAGLYAMKVVDDRRAEAAANERAEQRADEQAEAQAVALRKKEKKEAAAAAERDWRKSVVKEIQASITKDAKKSVSEGLLEGPIYYSTCDPLGGGSTDDLTALTTTFECLAVNEKMGDGTVRGYVFSATANWDEGSYSWRLGN